jgi:lipid-binding SYLF domain-containing protein
MNRRTASRAVLTLSAVVVTAAGIGCSTYRESGGDPSTDSHYVNAADSTISRFKLNDPTLSRFFTDSHAYAVFPKITKGGAGIGAAHGEGGVVYEKGVHVGFAEVTQVTVGAQLGGQSFSQIVFFQNASAFSDFKNNRTKFSGNASAVLAKSGSAGAADYSEGVAVFAMPISGAMLEASIGGQEFKYRAK